MSGKRRLPIPMCQSCHRPFKRRYDASSRYCSRLCFFYAVSGSNYSSKKPNCDWCKTRLRQKPSQLKKSKHHFCNYICYWKWKSKYCIGVVHPNWKGGWVQLGYKMLNVNGKTIQEHRHVMERHLGRHLKPFEKVHHLNHNRLDNRLENLEVMTQSEHAKHHGWEHAITGRKFHANALKELVALGLSTRQIAKRLHVRQSSVARSMTRLGIPFNFPTT